MDKVQLEINANQSKYWCRLQFTDKKGMEHEKQIAIERSATINSNLLQAIIDGFRSLNRPCMVDVYSPSEYITAPFLQGWVASWEKNRWKNAKGIEVKNSGQWQELKNAMAPHSVRFMHLEGSR